MDLNLLGETKLGKKDAKFNLFKFQDHLLEWISRSSEHFYERDYPSSFEALTIVYTDSAGFFDANEKENLKKLFDATQKANEGYIKYNIEFEEIKRRIHNHTFAPPSEIYSALLKFREELMKTMSKHNLLIPIIDKSMGSAAFE